MRLLRELRAHMPDAELVAGLPPDALRATMQDLASDLRELQAAIGEFETILLSWSPGGPAAD